jgi:hypothetical protein
MKHLFNDISSEEKNRILEMHKRSVDFRIIEESQEAALADEILRSVATVRKDEGKMEEIKNCIIKLGLNTLMVLTTPRGLKGLAGLAYLFSKSLQNEKKMPGLFYTGTARMIMSSMGLIPNYDLTAASEMDDLYNCVTKQA